jgi:hypothetical protein
VPKANLRAVAGSRPFEKFECSICKITFFEISDVADPKNAAVLKTALLKKWDGHLYAGHRRQWEFEQKKKAKFEAAQLAKWGTEKQAARRR